MGVFVGVKVSDDQAGLDAQGLPVLQTAVTVDAVVAGLQLSPEPFIVLNIRAADDDAAPRRSSHGFASSVRKAQKASGSVKSWR